MNFSLNEIIGLFAADDITPATVVAFYNGIKIKEVCLKLSINDVTNINLV